MNKLHFMLDPAVRVLAVIAWLSLSACSLVSEHYAEQCKTHAYSRTILADHIKSRYSTASAARMAVIPFSVPAIVSPSGPERPGMGLELAWRIQAGLLASGDIPIVEVLNRDWPGKHEEFFTGNFGAIAIAREAGYDLVLVGSLTAVRSLDRLTAAVKVIETESGITLYYGETEVISYQPELRSLGRNLMLADYKPSMVYTADLVNKMAQCVATEVVSDQVAQ